MGGPLTLPLLSIFRQSIINTFFTTLTIINTAVFWVKKPVTKNIETKNTETKTPIAENTVTKPIKKVAPIPAILPKKDQHMFSDMTLNNIKSFCRENNMRGYSTFTKKNNLIEWIFEKHPSKVKQPKSVSTTQR